MICLNVIFLNGLLLPFTNVKSQIDQLQNISLGKKNQRTLVSKFAILGQNWFKISAGKNLLYCL